jgi:hypothetical protein
MDFLREITRISLDAPTTKRALSTFGSPFRLCRYAAPEKGSFFKF